jgi:hypothetical protein
LPYFEALGCIGVFYLIAKPILKAPSWLLFSIIPLVVVVNSLAQVVGPTAESNLLLDFLFFPIVRSQYVMLYSFLGWFPVFLVAVLWQRHSSVFLSRFPAFARPIPKLVFAALCFATFILGRWAFSHGFTYEEVFHIRYYPPGAWYFLNSGGILIFGFALAQLSSMSQVVRNFLIPLGKHSLLVYLSHPYFFGLFGFLLFRSPMEYWGETIRVTLLYFAYFPAFFLLKKIFVKQH